MRVTLDARERPPPTHCGKPDRQRQVNSRRLTRPSDDTRPRTDQGASRMARATKPHALALAFLAAASALAALPARADEPTPPIRHGGQVRGKATALIHGRHARRAPAAPVSCSTPGGTNFTTDCAGPMPVNEPAIATNGSQFVAGANDY